jgi:adenine phosphoribosyltransferase
VSSARDALLREFRWVGGHADVWAVFLNAAALRAVVSGLVAPFRDAGITAVVGIESRGFLLGAAAAVDLGVGFVPVRKAGALFPGAKAWERTGTDYRGQETELAIQRESVGAGDRLLVVDDWVETGSQALAVARLIKACGGELVAISVMVDQLDSSMRSQLPSVHSLVSFADLPPHDD